jgi:hypothetical protein
VGLRLGVDDRLRGRQAPPDPGVGRPALKRSELARLAWAAGTPPRRSTPVSTSCGQLASSRFIPDFHRRTPCAGT